MGLNQFVIKVFKPPSTYRIEKKEGVNLHSPLAQHENKLIHEHEFTTVPIKGANTNYVVRCTTCGAYYCSFCGRAS